MSLRKPCVHNVCSDYVGALKDCIQAASLNNLYRTTDKTRRGVSGGRDRARESKGRKNK